MKETNTLVDRIVFDHGHTARRAWKETKIESMARLLNRLAEMGFSYQEAQALRKIERTLGRWAESECNGYIERDEETGKPYFVSQSFQGKDTRTPIADKEAGALKRLEAIMAVHPKLVSYHQTDPRGCALYVLRKSDVRAGENLDSVYTRGVAVCA